MASSIIGNLSFGGGTSYSGSKKLMDYQSALWQRDTQWLNENGWSQMRKGLINADYNPLLAIGSSPSSAPMSNATANQPTVGMDFASGSQANTAKQITLRIIRSFSSTCNRNSIKINTIRTQQFRPV